MKLIISVMAVLVLVAFAGSAIAISPGKTVEWEAKGGPGKVILDGKIHAGKGLKCMNCHTKIFQMKKGSAKMKMADINSGKFCGECHNGAKAFASRDKANCSRCHKK
jgi:c(7)-type cytochrome triheme protein